MCQPMIDDGTWSETPVQGLTICDTVTLLGQELTVVHCAPADRGGDFYALEAMKVSNPVDNDITGIVSMTLDKNILIMRKA